MNSLPLPGSANWVQDLNTKVASLLHGNAPFDENIFTWILYCLAAGDKHLILRTSPRDILSVQMIAKSILFSVLGMNTVLLRVRPDFTQEDLLAGLFPSSPFSSGLSIALTGSNVTPQVNLINQTERRARPRQNSQMSSSITAATAAGRSPSYTRGASLNRLSHLSPEHHHNPKFRLSVAATMTDVEDERGSVQGIRPLSGRGYLPPEHDLFGGLQSSSHVQLPHAIVVSGLESASSLVQETLWDVLRTRTVVLEQEGEIGNTWNLPDGFILIYVCSLGDGSSRPGIQSALLDRFSFNANVLPQAPSSPGLDPTKSPIQRRTALLKPEYIEQIQHLVHGAPLNDNLNLYISNLLSSIRYHPQLDTSLITSRCVKDVHEFTKASFVFTGSTIILSEDMHEDGHLKLQGMSTERRKVMTPDDVKRIIKHVVGHRINVREGAHEEVLGNLLCTAIERSRMDMDDRVEPRRPIKDILNEAIAAV